MNNPLRFHSLTPGEAADRTAFEEVIALAEERPAYLLADKGYDSDAIRGSLHEAGIRSCIPPKSNRKAKSAGTGTCIASATASSARSVS